MYHPLPPAYDRTLLDKAEAWAKAQPEITVDTPISEPGPPFAYPADLDYFVDEAVSRAAAEKSVKRLLNNKVVFIVKDDPKKDIYTLNCKPFIPADPEGKRWKLLLDGKYPQGYTVLNSLPFDRVVDIYSSRAGA